MREKSSLSTTTVFFPTHTCTPSKNPCRRDGRSSNRPRGNRYRDNKNRGKRWRDNGRRDTRRRDTRQRDSLVRNKRGHAFVWFQLPRRSQGRHSSVTSDAQYWTWSLTTAERSLVRLSPFRTSVVYICEEGLCGTTQDCWICLLEV